MDNRQRQRAGNSIAIVVLLGCLFVSRVAAADTAIKTVVPALEKKEAAGARRVRKNAGVELAPLVKAMVARTHTGANGKSLPYRLFRPANDNAKQRYPLVLFFHGAGSRGDDNQSQILQDGRGGPSAMLGVGVFLQPATQSKWPCFVVAPQCPAEQRWADLDWGKTGHTQKPITAEMTMVLEILAGLRKEFAIDNSRLYVTGSSMGGYGTWDIIAREPGLFAAAVPICGGGDVKTAPKITGLPVWAFHGSKDSIVPAENTRQMFGALQAADGNIRYFEYEGEAHGIWSRVYLEPELLPWLFAQKRP